MKAIFGKHVKMKKQINNSLAPATLWQDLYQQELAITGENYDVRMTTSNCADSKG